MLRAVLFDLYDTLVRVDDAGLTAKVATCAELATVDADVFRRGWFAVSMESNLGKYETIEARVGAVLRGVGRTPTADVVAAIAGIERAFLTAHVRPFPDAAGALGTLRADGLKLAIVSNASASAKIVMECCGLLPLVDAVVLSSDVGDVKPNPAIYYRTLDILEVPPAAGCFVGDGNDRELDGAKAVGLRAVLLRRNYPRYGVRASSSEAAVDATVDSLADVVVLTRRFFAAG